MRTIRLYQPFDTFQVNGTLTLTPSAAHKLIHVLRVGVGAVIHVFNGRGQCVACEITRVEKKSVQVRMVNLVHADAESSYTIDLVLGVSKNDRMAIALEKAVELGVNSITPVITAYSDVKCTEVYLEKKYQQWQCNVVQASEQCGRNTLAALHAPMRFNAYLGTLASKKGESRWCLEPTAATTFNAACLPHHKAKPCVCAIGPVGGWSEQEFSALQAHGFTGVSLGARVLRFETATAVVLGLLQYAPR